ncbi:MAG: alpha/beta hydrolase [Planctomycetota bacterium]|nr:alpha/beta hydrolase [Planctomycetota bacterium]
MTTCENMPERYRRAPGAAKAFSRRRVLALTLLAGLPFAARVAAAAAAATAVSSAPPRLPRDQLLLYRSRSGAVRTARSTRGWEVRRAEILRGFEAIAGSLPGRERRCPLELRILEESDEGSFVRRRITYQVEPGAWIESYLLVPKAALEGRRSRGVLCLHQTHAAGKKVVVGLGNSPDDEYGVELVRRGYVCLAPPYPQLADYQPDLERLGWVSGTLKAVWDNGRGLDLLESLPFVRRGGVAAIGHSLGGHNAIYTAVLDRRIRLVVTSCAFDAFVDYMGGDIRGWVQTRYLPRLKEYLGRPADIPFDFHELVGALAPRAFFASAPLGDTNFRWASVDRIAQAARQVYRLHRAEDRLVVRHPDGLHRFPAEVRQEAYEFMERHFGPA